MANVNARFDQPIPYTVSKLGELFLEGAKRVCATCSIDQLARGYILGEQLYCEEHRPEGFETQFQHNEQMWKDFQLEPTIKAQWMEWPTAEWVENTVAKWEAEDREQEREDVR
jgi:hypothetical protein